MRKNHALLPGVVLLCSALLVGCSDSSPRSPKNLLVICLDTVRADTFFGLAAMEDDDLSRWEEKAIIFKNAQAPSPWTVPSIGSVFTGLWPAHHGTGSVSTHKGSNVQLPTSKMNSDVSTLAEVASANGYKTGVVSASPWTGRRMTSLGLHRGFKDISDMSVKEFKDDWRPLVEAWEGSLLSEVGETNFFHFLHFMEAHSWHGASGDAVNKRYSGLSEEERERYVKLAPAQICENADSAKCRRFSLYVSAVEALRNGVAKTLQILERKNLLENTVVVVFSDHGEEFWDHYGDARLDGEGFPEPAKKFLKFYDDIEKEVENFEETIEAFGHGRTLYQEQLHVPLLVWHPEIEGEKVEAQVSLDDVGPSIARWAGFRLEPEHGLGVQLEDYLAENRSPPERTFYGSALSSGEPQLSALRGSKKAIWYMLNDHTDYYELDSDPGEQSSISNDKLVMEFDGSFMDYIQYSQNKKEAVAAELDSDQIRILQSIGYLQGIEAESAENSR